MRPSGPGDQALGLAGKDQGAAEGAGVLMAAFADPAGPQRCAGHAAPLSGTPSACRLSQATEI